ncbi:MAG: hypothetical protein AAF355_01990 [Myxococcota bacterium]
MRHTVARERQIRYRELRKAFSQISKRQLPDGYWRECLKWSNSPVENLTDKVEKYGHEDLPKISFWSATAVTSRTQGLVIAKFVPEKILAGSKPTVFLIEMNRLYATKSGEGRFKLVHPAMSVPEGKLFACLMPNSSSAEDEDYFKQDACIASHFRKKEGRLRNGRSLAPLCARLPVACDGRNLTRNQKNTCAAFVPLADTNLYRLMHRNPSLGRLDQLGQRASELLLQHWDWFSICLGLMHQLAVDLEILHRRGIMHVDIKPENVLVYCVRDGSGKEQYDARFTDFDLSAVLQRRTRFPGADAYLGVTEQYVDPLRDHAAVWETAVLTDIYSLGLVFKEMLWGPSSEPANAAHRARTTRAQSLRPIATSNPAARIRETWRTGLSLEQHGPVSCVSLLIERMCNPMLGLRPSADEVARELENIILYRGQA